MSYDQNWREHKATCDALDDGHGPATWDGTPLEWDTFLAWAKDHLGQGYSLACCEGTILDPVTSWAFKGFQAGMRVKLERESNGTKTN